MQAKDSEVPGTLQAFNQQSCSVLFIKVTFKMAKIHDFTRIYAFHLGKQRLS